MVDHHLEVRRGFPNTVYKAGQTGSQLIEVLRQIHTKQVKAMVTRVGDSEDAVVVASQPAYWKTSANESRGIDQLCRNRCAYQRWIRS